jgi:hypothetical protein
LVAVVLISRYQRLLQKIETIRTSLLRPIRSHEIAFLSLSYVSLATHADPYEATLSLSHSLSHVGCGEVAGHSSSVVIVIRWPAWFPSCGNEGGGRGRLHGGRERLLDGRRPFSSCSKMAFFLLLDGLHPVHPIASQSEVVQERHGARRRPNGGGVQHGADGHVVHVVHGHARVPGTGDHPRRGPRQRR